MGAFIGLNFVKSMLESTGAFEVYLNGDLLYSKLLTGRMPELHEIMSKIKLWKERQDFQANEMKEVLEMP